jgi:hypothetical protein
MVSGAGLKGLEKRKSLDPAENRTMLPRLSSTLPCRSPHRGNPPHVAIQYAVIQLRSSTSYFYVASLSNQNVSS